MTATTCLTLLANVSVVALFAAWDLVEPRWTWLLIPLPTLEIVAFTLVVCVFLATMHVRLRDIRQIWELAVQLLFFASPIVYPVGFLPEWAQKVAFVNPFVQALQDVRAAPDPAGGRAHGRRRLRDGLGVPAPRRVLRRDRDPRRALLPTRGALSRGAHVSGPAIEVADLTKSFVIPHQRVDTLKERFLHPFRRMDYERNEALKSVSFVDRAGRVLRDRRAERERQEHAAQDPRRDLCRRLGPRPPRRRPLPVHRARRRLQRRALGPRQRPDQRRPARADERGDRRALRRDRRLTPGSSASSTRS